MVRRIYILILCCSLSSLVGYSQDRLPLEHELKLAQYELTWHKPEVPFKLLPYPRLAFQDYDFALGFRKDKLEIRYLIVPPEPDSDVALIPHLEAPRMAMHLANNDDDSYIVAHEMDLAVLDSVYHADWGQTYFFPPKQVFSAAQNCQMLVLYREGVALCYVFMLFDDPPITLPERSQLLQFWPRKLLD